MKTIASLSLLFFGFCSFTTGGAQPKVTKEMQKFQGTWTVVELSVGNFKLDKLDKRLEKPSRLIIALDKIILIINGEELNCGAIHKTDPTREPNAIDIIEKIDKGTHITKAIYKFEGNRMKIAFPGQNIKTRPASFDAESAYIVVAERVKE